MRGAVLRGLIGLAQVLGLASCLGAKLDGETGGGATDPSTTGSENPESSTDETTASVDDAPELFSCMAELPCPTTSYGCDFDNCHAGSHGADEDCVYQALADAIDNGVLARLDYEENLGGPTHRGVVLLLGDGTGLIQDRCVEEGFFGCGEAPLGPVRRCTMHAADWYQGCAEDDPVPEMSLDNCQMPHAWFDACEEIPFTTCP